MSSHLTYLIAAYAFLVVFVGVYHLRLNKNTRVLEEEKASRLAKGTEA